MKEPFHILPFESLLDKWKQAGFTVGMEQYMRVNQLMNHWQKGDSLTRLKIKLGTILCQSEEAQHAFYDLFEECYERSFPDWEVGEEQEEKEEGPIKTPSSWWKWGAGVLAGMGVAVFMYTLGSGQKKETAGIRYIDLPHGEVIWLEDTAKPTTFLGFIWDSVSHRSWQVGQLEYQSWHEKDSIYQSLGDTSYSLESFKQYYYNFLDSALQDKDSAYIDSLYREAYTPEVVYKPLNIQDKVISLPHDSLKGDRYFKLTRSYARKGKDTTYINVRDHSINPLSITELSRPEDQERIFIPQVRELRIDSIPIYSQLYPIQQAWADSLEQWQKKELFSWRVNGEIVVKDTFLYTFPADNFPYELLLEYERYYLTTTGDTTPSYQATIRRQILGPTSPQEKIQPIRLPEFSILPEESIEDLLRADDTYWEELLVATFLLLLAFILYEVYQYRRRQKVLDSSKNLDLPLDQELKIDRPAINLFRSPGFEQAALLLRRQQASEAQELDIPTTLSETIEKWGFPHLMYQPRLLGVQYLFLIQQKQVEDQATRYFDELVSALNERDITVEAWYFEDDPTLCVKDRNRSEPEFHLYEEATAYLNYRLVIIGDAQGLLDPATDELLPQSAFFRAWPYRAWMVHRFESEWGKPEYELQKLFSVQPATEKGMLALVSQWTGEESEGLYTPLTVLTEEFPHILRREGQEVARVFSALRSYLGERGLKWLAACAIYPECYWEMTLSYGHMLHYFPPTASLTQQQLTTHTLRKLLQLPYLRVGRMPEKLRATLFTFLHEEDPSFLRSVRHYLIHLLEQPHHLLPQDSYARQKQKTLLAIYKYQNTERKADARRQLQEDLDEAGVTEEDVEEIVTIQTLSSKEHHPLKIPLPKDLYKGNIPFFGFRTHLRWIGTMMLIGLMWLLAWLFADRPPIPPYGESDLKDALVNLDNREQARYYNYQGNLRYDSLGRVFQRRADSVRLSLSAIDYFELAYQADPSYRASRYNLTSAEVNEMIRCYQRGFIDSAVVMLKGLAFQPYVEDSVKQAIPLAANAIGLFGEKAQSAVQGLLSIDSSYFDRNNSRSRIQDSVMNQREQIIQQLTKLFLEAEGSFQDTVEKVLSRFNGSLPYYMVKLEVRNAADQQFISDLVFEPTNVEREIREDYYVLRIPQYRKQATSIRLTSMDERFMDLDTIIELSYKDTAVVQWQMEPAKTWYLHGKVGWKVEPLLPFKGIRISSSLGNGEVKTQEEGRFRLKVKRVKKDTASTLPEDIWPIMLTARDPNGYIETQSFSLGKDFFSISENIMWMGEPDSVLGLSLQFKKTEPIYVEGGVFTMGDNYLDSIYTEEYSLDYNVKEHPVRVDNFYMDEHEVTVGQYLYFVQKTGRNQPDWLTDNTIENIVTGTQNVNNPFYYERLGISLFQLNHPIVGVSWNDATAYAEWLSDTLDQLYSLPSEAEWEYAARGGIKSDSTIYAGSNEIDKVAWYDSNSNSQTHPIKIKQANELGLYDMSGNVWEWCQDWYGEYPDISENDPLIYPAKGPETGAGRVFRGGSWFYDAAYCRVAYRYFDDPTVRYYYIGFRLRRTE